VVHARTGAHACASNTEVVVDVSHERCEMRGIFEIAEVDEKRLSMETDAPS
jgi:hypothetical protein